MWGHFKFGLLSVEEAPQPTRKRSPGHITGGPLDSTDEWPGKSIFGTRYRPAGAMGHSIGKSYSLGIAVGYAAGATPMIPIRPPSCVESKAVEPSGLSVIRHTESAAYLLFAQ